MTELQFEEAKLLYELVTKSRQTIDRDMLSKVIPTLGFSTKTEELLSRIDRLMRGMPIEDAFIAIAVWMEKCKFIHKLGQEQFPSSSSDKYQVPDLLAVFDHEGQEIAVLIEVKTSPEEFLPFAKLRFSERLYTKLNNYANLVGFPLLIAWNVRGYWVLFDIREMKQRESAYHIDSEDALKADLMHLLLGNLLIVPKPGVSFTFVIQDLGTVKQLGLQDFDSTDDEPPGTEQHIGAFHGIRFLDADDKPITKLSWPQFFLWTFVEHEEKQSRQGNLFELTFEVPEDASLLPTYVFLQYMLSEWRSKDRLPKNWYDVIKKEDFGPFSYSQFKEAIDDGLGTLIQYVIKQVPYSRPDFLPAGDSLQGAL